MLLCSSSCYGLIKMYHSFWLWVYYNAPTIQAFSAFMGLLGLAYYARETRRIRIATLAQSDASRRPYFHAEDWEVPKNLQDAEEFEGKDYYQFKNCGSGIALEVCWRFLSDSKAPLVPLGSCAVGRVKYIFTSDWRWVEYDEIESHEGVYLEYKDTAGKRYWTKITIKRMADNTLHTLVDTGSISK